MLTQFLHLKGSSDITSGVRAASKNISAERVHDSCFHIIVEVECLVLKVTGSNHHQGWIEESEQFLSESHQCK